MTQRIALITGASSGIGKALAAEFARDGYDVVLAARSVEKMQALAEQLQAEYSVTATVIAADLETPDGAKQLHADIRARNLNLTALANNAGYGLFGKFPESSLDDELAMMRLNMNSLVILTKLFLPDILESRGKILNLASTAAFQPGPYMAVYYASKSFVLSFSEALAEELAGSGVQVTALCPGPTASGFQDKAAMQKSALVKNRKLPSAEEVAAKGYRAMQRGKRVYIPGAQNWLLAQSIRFTPRRVVTRLVKHLSRPM